MQSSPGLTERRAAGGRATAVHRGVLACLCGAIVALAGVATAGVAPPPADSGCERPLRLAPARGPAGTIVEGWRAT